MKLTKYQSHQPFLELIYGPVLCHYMEGMVKFKIKKQKVFEYVPALD